MVVGVLIGVLLGLVLCFAAGVTFGVGIIRGARKEMLKDFQSSFDEARAQTTEGMIEDEVRRYTRPEHGPGRPFERPPHTRSARGDEQQ